MDVTTCRANRSTTRTRLALAALALAGLALPAAATAQATASVQVLAMVVPRVTTTATRMGSSSVRPVAGGVVVTQQMALESNVDSQSLEAELAPVPADTTGASGDRPVAVSVRCGGHAGRCRLSGGTTPRIAIEVEVLGLSAQEVKLAVAAPERFAARVSYRLVRGEGT